MTEKLCVNCARHRITNGKSGSLLRVGHWCHHLKSVSPVTGEKVYSVHDCDTVRKAINPTRCGPSGLHFIQKPMSPGQVLWKTILKKLQFTQR